MHSEHDDLIDKYRMGASCPELAKRIGRSTSYVWGIIRAAGIGRSHAESMALRMSKYPNLSEQRGLQCNFHSKKSCAWVPAGSRYEFIRMAQLEADPTVVRFSRVKDRIQYCFDGVSRYYIPDLLVELVGEMRVEEIKPAYLVQTPKIMAKVAAASAYYTSRGLTFHVITECDIGRSYIKNFEWSGFAALSHDDREAARCDRERTRHRLTKRRQLAAMTPTERQDRNEQQRIYYQSRKASSTEAELAQRRAKDTEAQRRHRERIKQRELADNPQI